MFAKGEGKEGKDEKNSWREDGRYGKKNADAKNGANYTPGQRTTYPCVTLRLSDPFAFLLFAVFLPRNGTFGEVRSSIFR